MNPLLYNNKVIMYGGKVVMCDDLPPVEPILVTQDMATFLGTESGDDGLMIMVQPKKTFSFTTLSFYSLKSRTHSSSDDNVCFFGRVFEVPSYSQEVENFTEIMAYNVSHPTGTAKLKYDSSTGLSTYVIESTTSQWYGVPGMLKINGVNTEVYKYTVKLQDGSPVTFEEGKVYVIGDYISTYNSGTTGYNGRQFIYCDNIDASCLLCKTSRFVGEVEGQKCIRSTEEFTKLPYILFDDKLITDYI